MNIFNRAILRPWKVPMKMKGLKLKFYGSLKFILWKIYKPTFDSGETIR